MSGDTDRAVEAGLREAMMVALSVALHERADPGCTGEPSYFDTQAEAEALTEAVVRAPMFLAAVASSQPITAPALRGLPPATCYRTHTQPDEGKGVFGAVWLADVERALASSRPAAPDSPSVPDHDGACGAILNCALPTNHDGLHERADGIRWSWHENIDHLPRRPSPESTSGSRDSEAGR